jgi:hypothetical protein
MKTEYGTGSGASKESLQRYRRVSFEDEAAGSSMLSNGLSC